MPWIQIKFNATDKNAERISDMLMDETGALSVTFLDAKDNPIFEPLPGETRLWGETDIVALYDAEVDTNQVIEQVKASDMLTADFAYKVEQLEDKDWEREWMDNFHPMQFGERLWVCPSWKKVPDPSAINVMLDPGLAFGTGTHPTTSLCLEWLEKTDLKGKTVIDFGCGSGILAIAAIKLGQRKSLVSILILKPSSPLKITQSEMAWQTNCNFSYLKISQKDCSPMWLSPIFWLHH